MEKYVNLATALRPTTFDKVVYNEHVSLVLKSMLVQNKVPTGVLFSGVRGVGKTSLSRLFARALNCQNRVDYNPCNECESCKMSLVGNHPDIVEVSGSTNGNIDDIRKLMDQAMLSPIIGKYRVFIIDEVQGLGRSQSSFDALLKVLEEPPAHVVWLFCTTAKNKLPETIKSRLVSLDLKSVPTDTISDYLNSTALPGQVTFPKTKKKDVKAVTDVVAFGAKNSIRDALTLLEKVIPYCNEKGWSDKNALFALGSMESAKCFSILEAIANYDSKLLWSELENIINSGIDVEVVFNDGVLEAINNLLLVSIGGQSLYADEYLSYFQKIGPARVLYLADVVARRNEQFNNSNNKKFMLQFITIELCMK
jgi:DNA polymerase III subunit gamma/tau